MRINTRTPPDNTVTRKVLKVWKDERGSNRPIEITVQLLCDDEVYDTVKLHAGNDWRYTWTRLPEYGSNGHKIEWRIVENELEGYYVTVAQEGIPFVVTNTQKPDTPPDNPPDNPPYNPPILPQTGILWWPVPVLAVAGLVFLLAGLLLNKRKSHE